ncbi:MAG: methyltransferase domain-containing protein [Candidatus Tantalella remota]|nr:methyltransferase domain-containing protein [Candidatus Tantalella remota]
METAARISFVVEEGIFAGVFLNFLPWFNAVTGFLLTSNTTALYLLSIIAFSVSHDTVYRWRKEKVSLIDSFGLPELKTIQKIKSAGRAGWPHYLGFALIGALFRSSYLIPGVSPVAGLLAAMGLHALYNNVIAPKFNFPLGMGASYQRKLDLFTPADQFSREKKLVEYGIFSRKELDVVKDLYDRLRMGEELSLFAPVQILYVWRYMILTDMEVSQKELFEKVDAELCRIMNEDGEVEGVYTGYEWGLERERGLKSTDKIETIRKNIEIGVGERMLDIGCGNGLVLIGLARAYPRSHFIGIDASARNIAAAIRVLTEMGEKAPRNLRFHVRDCRGIPRGEKILSRGVPYNDETFDIVSLLEGVMDEAAFRDPWQKLMWDEVIRVAKKDGARIAFFGLRGEAALKDSLPAGIDAESQHALFYIDNKSQVRFYPFWGRVNEYRWDWIEMSVYKLGLAKEPQIISENISPAPFSKKPAGPEQLDLFDGSNGATPTGMIGWIWLPLVKRGYLSMETAARFSFTLEEGFFSGLLLNFAPWFLAVLGFLDPSQKIIFYLASIVLYSVSHQSLYRWVKESGVTYDKFRMPFIGQKLRIKDTGEPGLPHYAGFAVLGAAFRAAYFIPGVNPLLALVGAMAVHAVYNNFIAPRLNLPVGMARSNKQKKADRAKRQTSKFRKQKRREKVESVLSVIDESGRVEEDEAGLMLEDEVMSVLPREDQLRIDAAVRLMDHIIRMAALNEADLQRFSAEPERFAIDNIPGRAVLEFVREMKRKGADISKVDEGWEEEFFRFLFREHELFDRVKLTPQFVFRAHFEAKVRNVPARKERDETLNGVSLFLDMLLSTPNADKDELYKRASLLLEEWGMKEFVAWTQGSLDQLALYAEGAGDEIATRRAREFLEYFIDRLFDSSAMAHAFMFNRSIVEGFLDSEFAEKNDVGVVYLHSGAAHLCDQAREIAEAKGAAASRMHALHFNRRISEEDPDVLREYLKQEGINKYRTLVIVDTGFHGSSAARLYDIMMTMPEHPENVHARVLSLNEQSGARMHEQMDIIGWNRVVARIEPAANEKEIPALFFITHILDNSLPLETRSPAGLARDPVSGRLEPVALETEMPVFAGIARESMRKGTRKLFSGKLAFSQTGHDMWEEWLPEGASDNMRGFAGPELEELSDEEAMSPGSDRKSEGKGKLNAALHLTKGALRYFSEEVIERIERTVTWEDFSPDGLSGRRSAILKLREPVRIKGRLIKAIKIKGICYRPEERGEAGLPRTEIYNGARGHRPPEQKPIFNEKGIVRYPPTGPRFKGLESIDNVINEIDKTNHAFYEGNPVHYVLGYGEYDPDQFDGIHPGFVIMGLEDEEDERLPSNVLDEVAGMFGSSRYEIQIPMVLGYELEEPMKGEMRRVFEEYFRRYGRALRELHDSGYIHGSPHLFNVTAVSGRIIFHDIDENSYFKKDLTPAMALGHQMLDVWRAVSNLKENLTGTHTLADVQKSSGARFIRPFLEGYFADLDQAEVAKIDADTMGDIFYECKKTPIQDIDRPVVDMMKAVIAREPLYIEGITVVFPGATHQEVFAVSNALLEDKNLLGFLRLKGVGRVVVEVSDRERPKCELHNAEGRTVLRLSSTGETPLDVQVRNVLTVAVRNILGGNEDVAAAIYEYFDDVLQIKQAVKRAHSLPYGLEPVIMLYHAAEYVLNESDPGRRNIPLMALSREDSADSQKFAEDIFAVRGGCVHVKLKAVIDHMRSDKERYEGFDEYIGSFEGSEAEMLSHLATAWAEVVKERLKKLMLSGKIGKALDLVKSIKDENIIYYLLEDQVFQYVLEEIEDPREKLLFQGMLYGMLPEPEGDRVFRHDISKGGDREQIKIVKEVAGQGQKVSELYAVKRNYIEGNYPEAVKAMKQFFAGLKRQDVFIPVLTDFIGVEGVFYLLNLAGDEKLIWQFASNFGPMDVPGIPEFGKMTRDDPRYRQAVEAVETLNDDLKAKLAGFLRRLECTRPLMMQARDTYLKALDEFSGTEGDGEGVPAGMIGRLWEPLVRLGFMSRETAARLSFLEEGLFAGVFLNLLPWFNGVTGFMMTSNTTALYLLSIIAFSASHETLYRWRKEKVLSINSFGFPERDKVQKIKASGTPGWSHYIGFAFLGAVFRSAYLIPGINPAWALAAAMTLHALYNNYIAGKVNLPVAMTARGYVKQRVDAKKKIKGAAMEPLKLEAGALMGVVAAGVLMPLWFLCHKSIFALVLGLSYILTVCIIPIVTACHINDVLSFRHPRKDYGLIKPFEKAENIRYIERVIDEDDAKGKISYYSYTIEDDLKSGGEHVIKSALFAHKTALRHMPRFYQWVIYFHEAIHSKMRVKVEAVAVPLTFSLPWAAGCLILILAGGWTLPLKDTLLLSYLIAYNLLVPLVSGLVVDMVGLLKKSPGGHYVSDSKVRQHLTAAEVDKYIADHAHSQTYNKETGKMVYWRNWLGGGRGRSNVEFIECPGRPEDIIVVKSSYKLNRTADQKAFREKIASSDKRSFVLIIADDGPKAALNKKMNKSGGKKKKPSTKKVKKIIEKSREARKHRITRISAAADKILKSMQKKDRWGFTSARRFVKKDVRSTSYDITILRDLLGFYRRRLSRIKHEDISREVVICETHGHTHRLKVLLKWLKENRYKSAIFLGDYLGKSGGGLEAMDMLRRHMKKGIAPRVTLIMGNSEHVFMRAFLGDDRWSDSWTSNCVMEGPEVVKSLHRLANGEVEGEITPEIQKEINDAKDFEDQIKRIVLRNGTDFEEEWNKWYRMHPQLIKTADFITENMKFVYHEDAHHNIYKIGNIPDDFTRNGLCGIEALEEMEQEFRQGTESGLRLLKLMREIWLLLYRDVKTDVEEEAAQRKRVLDLIRAEKDVIFLAGREKYRHKDPRRVLIQRYVLNTMESIILEEPERENLDSIFNDLSEKMASVTRPLPEVFDKVFDVTEGQFMVQADSRFKKEDDESEEARQEKRIELGVNTIITTNNFPDDEGFQSLRYARAMDRTGTIRMIDVDTLEGKDRPKGGIALVARTAQEEFYVDDGMFLKELASDTPEEKWGSAKGRSLESVTRRKLEGVEKIIDDIDHVAANIKEGPVRELWSRVKYVAGTPLFKRTAAVTILIAVMAYSYFLQSEAGSAMAGLIYMGAIFTDSNEYKKNIETEMGDMEEEFSDIITEFTALMNPESEEDEESMLGKLHSLRNKAVDLLGEVGVFLKGLEKFEFRDDADIDDNEVAAMEEVHREVKDESEERLTELMESAESLIEEISEEITQIQGEEESFEEEEEETPVKPETVTVEGLENELKEAEEITSAGKLLGRIHDLRRAYIGLLLHHPKEEQPDLYGDGRFGRIAEMFKGLKERAEKIGKGPGKTGGSLIEALFMASVAGMLISIFVPMGLLQKGVLGFDLKYMMMVYGGFVAGVIVVGLLQQADRMIKYHRQKAEWAKPLKAKRLLVLDDSEGRQGEGEFAPSADAVALLEPEGVAEEDGRASYERTGVSLKEIEKAIDEINEGPFGRTIDSHARLELSRKVYSMRLQKGKSFLVVGPGHGDGFSVLLTKLGLRVTVIDTDKAAIDTQIDVLKMFGIASQVEVTSSYEDISESSFDYVSMFAVLDNVLNPTRDDQLRSLIKAEMSGAAVGSGSGRAINENMAKMICEKKVRNFIMPILQRLNTDDAYIFVNCPSAAPLEKCRQDPQGLSFYEKHLFYLDNALADIGNEFDVDFAVQDVDVDNLNINVLTPNREVREGIVYRMRDRAVAKERDGTVSRQGDGEAEPLMDPAEILERLVKEDRLIDARTEMRPFGFQVFTFWPGMNEVNRRTVMMALDSFMKQYNGEESAFQGVRDAVMAMMDEFEYANPMEPAVLMFRDYLEDGQYAEFVFRGYGKKAEEVAVDAEKFLVVSVDSAGENVTYTPGNAVKYGRSPVTIGTRVIAHWSMPAKSAAVVDSMSPAGGENEKKEARADVAISRIQVKIPDKYKNKELCMFPHPDGFVAVATTPVFMKKVMDGAREYAGEDSSLANKKRNDFLRVIGSHSAMAQADDKVKVPKAIQETMVKNGFWEDVPGNFIVEERDENLRVWPADEYLVDNAKKVVSFLANALMSWSGQSPDEKYVLAIDPGKASKSEVAGMIKDCVIDPLKRMNGNNSELEIILRNLHIVVDEGKNLSRRLDAMTSRGKNKIKKENIVIVSPKSDMGYFEVFKDVSFLTGFDDSELKTSGKKVDYYPVVEVALFAVLRAVKARSASGGAVRAKQLIRWYRHIPNARSLNEEDFMAMCFDEDGNSLNTVVIDLIPKAARFDHSKLNEIYKTIRAFIESA